VPAKDSNQKLNLGCYAVSTDVSRVHAALVFLFAIQSSFPGLLDPKTEAACSYGTPVTVQLPIDAAKHTRIPAPSSMPLREPQTSQFN